LKHIIQNLNSDIKKSRFVCSDIFSNDVAMYICMYVCMYVCKLMINQIYCSK